jgi:exopolyphosphatase/guanosine-5'-triphosphate,3'-diphosphate pyrophosphatase
MPDLQSASLLAAIDLGSNSFRLEICKIEHGQLLRVEYLKDTVRLGAGLGDTRELDDASMNRGWASVARFAERVRDLEPRAVRAVATATLREALNREAFLARAQSLLGLPIDVISGHEEARLIYGGVAHYLPDSDEDRLVFLLDVRRAHRSISPMTMSTLALIAITSDNSTPSQSLGRQARLMKDGGRMRQRTGLAVPSDTK